MGQALGCIQVEQSNVCVTKQFGKYDRTLNPGFHCLPWCLGKEVAGVLSLRVKQLILSCETKTKDNVFLTLVTSIHYRALEEKAADAIYKLTCIKKQIRDYVFDVVRAIIPKSNLDTIYEQKNEIAKAVKDELNKAVSAYGYEILQTLIVDIKLDVNVKKNMSAINQVARLTVAASEYVEAKKLLRIKRAEAEAESKYLLGLGIARQRQAIVDGLRDSVLSFTENVPGTTSKDTMGMLLQYFNTIKEIGAPSESNATVPERSPGAVMDIVSQVRDELLHT